VAGGAGSIDKTERPEYQAAKAKKI